MNEIEEKPILLAREGGLDGQRWPIDSDPFTIGRGHDCDVILPARQVSRYHARIRRADGRYLLEDLDSKNGTFCNGRQTIESTILQDGDEIRIASDVKLLFVGTEATLTLVVAPADVSEGLQIDEAQRAVYIKGELLDPPLSPAQFRLLQLLHDAAGAVVSRDEIAAAVWADSGGVGVTEQAIDALVRRLRDRLAELDERDCLVTVRGHGFRLDRKPAEERKR
jgi:pSer/pThr/pTyr-binding forkhead associated (FHA) protein